MSGIGFGLGVDRTLLALRAEGKSVGSARSASRVRSTPSPNPMPDKTCPPS
ncbi:hypothetical protein JHV675_52570 [Mycobacterium avium subsp. hominissuis]